MRPCQDSGVPRSRMFSRCQSPKDLFRPSRIVIHIGHYADSKPGTRLIGIFGQDFLKRSLGCARVLGGNLPLAFGKRRDNFGVIGTVVGKAFFGRATTSAAASSVCS